MNPTRSGMCLGPDKPQMHKLCRGTFNPGAGEVEHSGSQSCGCDCHREGTPLHEQVRGSKR